MFDVYYINKPTGLFAHEQQANSIEQARETCRTRYLWVVDHHNDYSGFDWTWEPAPWERDQAHVWPSQHQDNGGTWLIPKQGYADVNRNHAIIPRKQSAMIIGIDHGNGLTVRHDRHTRYIGDYLGTLKRVLGKVDVEYAWVVSSVCDYTDFDFSWHPSEWQQDMLHVFASDKQKFGDTFYVHVPSFLKKSQDIALLEWFDTIHFVEDITVPRKPVPVVRHDHDTQVTAVWEHTFIDPVVQFTVGDAVKSVPALNLWRQETRAITPLTQGASSVLVPREAKNFIKTQLYDYPVIDKDKSYNNNAVDHPLDIVFISNGENNADYNWSILSTRPYNSNNRVVRVDGVNGRAAAYRAAAEASDTPWFFAVFAKLEINQNFDWKWQPDRLQQSKHYIFHAKNPVNGLTYGHQAIIAYNKKLVLANPAQGLDFTLDQPHEVVPLLSGTATYHTSSWMCWRTAFREALKLRHSLPDVENEYRLKQWLEKDNTPNQWSMKGAQDAIEYYESVNGDFDAIKKSYEWDWLASYALIRRNLLPDQ